LRLNGRIEFKHYFFTDKEAKDKDKAAQSLAVPRLSVCADAQKVDRAKLAQTEVSKMPTNDACLGTEENDERGFFESSRYAKLKFLEKFIIERERERDLFNYIKIMLNYFV